MKKYKIFLQILLHNFPYVNVETIKCYPRILQLNMKSKRKWLDYKIR